MDVTFKDLIKPFLIQVLQQENEYPVVRHEAGEGLSNFASDYDELVPIFEKYSQSCVDEVKYTCLIGLEKIKTYN